MLTLNDLSRALVPALEGMDSSLRADTLTQLADVFVERSMAPRDVANVEPRTRRVDKSLNEPRTYYVIHEGDLALLKDVVAAAVSLIPKLNPIATVPTLVGLLFRYRRKRARIDDKQAAVLLALRAKAGGCTVVQLSQQLSSLKEPMSEADVEVALRSLQRVVLSDGTSSDFVAETGGLWRAVDV